MIRIPRSASALVRSAANSRCICLRGYASQSAPSKLKRTPLYDLHVALQAKFGPFASYDMPLYYPTGGATEHKHTRASATIFDVSHMVQSRISGSGATAFLSHLCPSSISGLQYSDNKFHATLSVLLNEQGGIIDDLMITRQGEENYYLVTNAGRREQDLPWIERQLQEFNSANGKDVKFQVDADHALLALQGPQASAVLQKLTKAELDKLYFGQSANLDINGQTMHVARSGYTGEDGFEISVPAESAISFSEKLLENSAVLFAGLAARDSLRIEAGLCLYGHDITEDTTPIEAGLTWLVGKDRRSPGAFIGSERILQQLEKGAGPERRRVGFTIQGAPAREGAKIFDQEGQVEIGTITSGIPSPTLGQNIAMGYIKTGYHKKDTPVMVEVRKKQRAATVTRMPFVPAKYYKPA